MTFTEELRQLINRKSMESGSNTPDFAIAEFLADCLTAYESAINKRNRYMPPHKLEPFDFAKDEYNNDKFNKVT